MITSGDKTKLLIIGKKSNRANKINDSLKISVCGEYVFESQSERLLGLVINNTLTGKHHLFGDEDNLGLLKELSKRIGILRKLREYMPEKNSNKLFKVPSPVN